MPEAVATVWTYKGLRPDDMSRQDLIDAVGELGRDLIAEREAHARTRSTLGQTFRYRAEQLHAARAAPTHPRT